MGHAERCPDCDTSIQVMVDIGLARDKPRFLFGRLRPDEMTWDPFEGQPPPPIDIPEATPPPVRRKEAAPVIAMPVPETESRPVEEPESRFSWPIDVGACLLMNAFVLLFVVWVSPRSFQQLITYSLIPVISVLLVFTGLYFGLFLGLFHRSFGKMIVDRIR